MLDALKTIVQEVREAKDLDQALEIIVVRVREAMGADACSIYLSQEQSGSLRLRATSGLKAESVGNLYSAGNTGLAGLVLERQEPLNLENASLHPRFRYAPEMGEEHLKGFLSVPIIQFGQVMGILVVQQESERLFRGDEVDFAVTIATQLAGAMGQALGYARSSGLEAPVDGDEIYWQGQAGAPGVAIGTIAMPFPLARLESVPNRPAANVEEEVSTLRNALAAVGARLQIGRSQLAEFLSSDARGLFDVYELMLNSDTMASTAIRKIEEGNWAPGAWRDTVQESVQAFQQMSDPYLQARAEDVRNVGAWVLAEMESQHSDLGQIPDRCLLVGDDIGIGQIAEIPNERLAAIVCLSGSAMSHTAILARTLGIPAVMGLGNLPIEHIQGFEAIVDGYQGRVYPNPPQALRKEFERVLTEEKERAADLQQLVDLPAVTPDGITVPLFVKAGLLADVTRAVESGASGIGLYRTEVGFMIRASFPNEDEQYEVYRNVLKVFAPRPVAMRTLDVGGDKSLPYFPIIEPNPFLGWRGIRLTLDHPELFLVQIRAMLRANEGLGNLQIMLPMITTPTEVRQATALIDRACRELVEEGFDTARRPPIVAMIETPAAVFAAARIARLVDSLSIGSNDLTQYMLAVDRSNPQVARLYDSLEPVVLEAIYQVVKAGHHEGQQVSVCGEMTDDPKAALILLGMGVDSMSTTASSLPRIKWLIRNFSQRNASALFQAALALESAAEVRQLAGQALKDAGLADVLQAGRRE